MATSPPPPAPPPPPRQQYLNIVVEGCCHGALDEIYGSVRQIEARRAVKVDLVVCCGDFQALRNEDDFEALAVPAKFRSMASFWKYYRGDKVAPYPTVIIGGNHEASNYMLELFHGGWVAPNIYYLGHAGAVEFGGLRIAGSSGIFKQHDFHKGHHERPPFDKGTLRSVYHVRETQVFQLSQLRLGRRVDVFLSHDWPVGVYRHGDVRRLLRAKPFFKDEVESNTLGSPAMASLLAALQPEYWFAAHLHCKFAAIVPHPPVAAGEQPVPAQAQAQAGRTTRFLALDKCLPRRDFLQLLTVPRPADDVDLPGPPQLRYDCEWLAIMRSTHALLSRSPHRVQMPTRSRLVTPQDVEWVRHRLVAAHGSTAIPNNFVQTAPAYPDRRGRHAGPLPNPQTDALLRLLELEHRVTDPPAPDAPDPPPLVPAAVLTRPHLHPPAPMFDENEIDIDAEPDEAAADENEIDIEGLDDEATPAPEPSAVGAAAAADDHQIDIDGISDDEAPPASDSVAAADDNEIDLHGAAEDEETIVLQADGAPPQGLWTVDKGPSSPAPP